MMAGRNLLFRFVDVFLTVHWSDARENFEELIREVNQFGDFSITIDFILKNMLVLYADDIKVE